MSGKFEILVAKNGQFYFNLKARNGQIILTSEMYKQKSSCENGINSVKENSKDENLFEIKESKNGKPYFILKAKNHQEIGRSEIYESMSACKNGIKSVQTNAPEGKVVEV